MIPKLIKTEHAIVNFRVDLNVRLPGHVVITYKVYTCKVSIIYIVPLTAVFFVVILGMENGIGTF